MTQPSTKTDSPLDAALEALRRLEPGEDLAALEPIDSAVRACHADPSSREALERALAGILHADVSWVARDLACRALRRIGTSQSVGALARLLDDRELSHRARYALERMPCDEAAEALRNALSTREPLLRVGMINSLGARRDEKAVPRLRDLLDSADRRIVEAAAAALGKIGSCEAASALLEVHEDAPTASRLSIADALLACAEHLETRGLENDARAIYESLDSESEAGHIRRAAAQRLGSQDATS